MATQFPEGYRLIDGNYFRIGDRSGPYVIDDNGVATLIGTGGGGGGGAESVTVTNFPETQAIAGAVSVSNLPETQAISAAALPLPAGAATQTTLAAISTATGAAGAAAYTDATGAASGTLIALLKGIYVQNAAIISLLTQIETNTATP